jgi:hypothetical protein
MKFFKVVLPGVIIAVAFFCWLGLSDADSANLWPNKHGELCWEVTPPMGTQTIVKLAVVRTVGDHYIVHGTITETLITGEEYVRCLNGNAEIVDNKVIIHGSTSGIYGTELIGALGMVELELSTLNGFSEGLQMWCDVSSGLCEVKYDGTVTWNFISSN